MNLSDPTVEQSNQEQILPQPYSQPPHQPPTFKWLMILIPIIILLLSSGLYMAIRLYGKEIPQLSNQLSFAQISSTPVSTIPTISSAVVHPTGIKQPILQPTNPLISSTPNVNSKDNSTDKKVYLDLTSTSPFVHKLVNESRDSIISAGLSSEYVDNHFHVFKITIDESKPIPQSNWAIYWEYSVGEWNVDLDDTLGYFTNPDGTITYNHYIGGNITGGINMPKAHEIYTLLTKQQAQSKAEECIINNGKSINDFNLSGDVKYGPFGLGGTSNPTLRYFITGSKAMNVPPHGLPTMISSVAINLETGTCETRFY